jgi:hypothetical protein
METLELENLGVSNISPSDSVNLNGGIFGIDDLVIGILVGAAVQIMADWDNFERGLAGAPSI